MYGVKIYWWFIACLFSTLPLSIGFTLVARLFGCDFVGCPPGTPAGEFLGNIGGLGFWLVFVTFITYPLGIVLSVVGIIAALALSTKKMYEEPNPANKAVQKKSLFVAIICILVVALILFGIPWIVINLINS